MQVSLGEMMQRFIQERSSRSLVNSQLDENLLNNPRWFNLYIYMIFESVVDVCGSANACSPGSLVQIIAFIMAA